MLLQIRLLVAGIGLEFDFVEIEFRYYEIQRLHYFIPDFIRELNKIKVGGGERRLECNYEWIPLAITSCILYFYSW